MRKISFCLLSTFYLFFLSSCLGESNSKLSVDPAYGIVKSSDQGVVYAAVSGNNGMGAYITSSEIKNLTVGSCLSLAYTISSDGEVSNNIMTATDVYINQIIPQSLLQRKEPNALDTTSVKAINIVSRSDSKFFDDRWFLSANYPLKTGEKLEDVKATCYYDPNDQPTDDEGNPIPNRVVLDIRFSNINPNTDPNVTTIAETYLFALNLTPLRSIYTPTYSNVGTTKQARVEIVFRYLQKQLDGTSKEVDLGTWNSNTSYYMLFE